MKKSLLLILVCIAGYAGAQNITLPKPVTHGGKPLMNALNDRQTIRSFSSQELSLAQLSNLLWAANGVNRGDGKRTAPSASNCQEIDIYVFLKTGVYLYNPSTDALEVIEKGDHRGKVGRQAFIEKAPVVLVFVANWDKMARYKDRPDDQQFYAGTDVGFVSQNVYLYAASESMSTVVLGMVNRDSLAKLLKLKNGKVMLGQPVGFPKKK
ncbi:MAG: SagB/ThcOx family dehydrogenase [Prevotellaceae bacterium]|jgi:SagB-type dehydrogenase family enzyme|nr:SagB/ThcOx family dehydrogenase [Prevotellaceae bacterium]